MPFLKKKTRYACGSWSMGKGKQKRTNKGRVDHPPTELLNPAPNSPLPLSSQGVDRLHTQTDV